MALPNAFTVTQNERHALTKPKTRGGASRELVAQPDLISEWEIITPRLIQKAAVEAEHCPLGEGVEIA